MDATFDENSTHRLEKYSKQIRTRIDIDFWNGCVKIYVILPQKKDSKSTENLNNSMKDFLNSKKNHPIISKQFKISDDFKSVIFEDVVYSIPDFFDKTMVKNKDIKTWQMIFYQIFSEEVFIRLRGFKELSKKKDED